MVPTMIALLLNDPGFRPERLASLRDLVYGASPIRSFGLRMPAWCSWATGTLS